jgi:hypothetical protein
MIAVTVAVALGSAAAVAVTGRIGTAPAGVTASTGAAPIVGETGRVAGAAAVPGTVPDTVSVGSMIASARASLVTVIGCAGASPVAEITLVAAGVTVGSSTVGVSTATSDVGVTVGSATVAVTTVGVTTVGGMPASVAVTAATAWLPGVKVETGVDVGPSMEGSTRNP